MYIKEKLKILDRHNDYSISHGNVITLKYPDCWSRFGMKFLPLDFRGHIAVVTLKNR